MFRWERLRPFAHDSDRMRAWAGLHAYVDMLVTGIPLLRRVKIAECLHGSAVGHGSILDWENAGAVTNDC